MRRANQHRKIDLLRYGVLAFPLMFVGVPLYVYAPEFYASEFSIPLATIGFVLLGLRGVDAVQDLLIGKISDHFHRLRHYVMCVGMITLSLGFWLVFHPSEHYTLISFAAGMLLSATGFSIVSINFQALGALWRADSHARTRITSWREGIGLVGLLAASAAPTLLGHTVDAPRAFHLLTLIFLPILAMSALIFFGWMRNAPLQRTASDDQKKTFKRLYNRWNINFLAIYTFNTFASAIPAVLVVFFITDRLQAEELTGLFLLLYFISGACGMPLWNWLAGRIGKQQAWMASMLLAAIVFVFAFPLAAGDVIAFGIICVLAGLAFGADLAIPPSIIADRIEMQRDEDITSYYFSATTFLSKTALALATGVSLPILGMLGYQPGDVTDYAVTNYLSYAYALIPALLKASVALWLWRFTQQTNKGDDHVKTRNLDYEPAHLS